MDTQERTMILNEVSNHIGILEYDLMLSDNDIDDLTQDYSYCYDSYFENKKESEQWKLNT